MNDPSPRGAPRPTHCLPDEIARIRRPALLCAGAGAALCALGAALNPAQFFRSYLVAFMFWLSVALGSFALLMLQHIARGAWGVTLQRPLEAASRTLAGLAVLFVPLLFGLPRLYEWARPEAVRESEQLAHQAAYLNVRFFIGRAIVYFAVWVGFARALSQISLAQDSGSDPGLVRRLRSTSAIGLLLYGLTVTFASIDWLMSLNARWESTIYGIYVIGGQAISAMSFAIVIALFLSRHPPVEGVIVARHFHDYGKLLLAFVMLWAYYSVSQLIVIWSGNLPEEITWYTSRLLGVWRWVSLGIVLFHFALPFALLLSRDLKRNAPRLATVAGLLLVMRWLDLYWLVTPEFSPARIAVHWLDFAALIALGGGWLWLFVRELESRPLVPILEPTLSEAPGHGE